MYQTKARALAVALQQSGLKPFGWEPGWEGHMFVTEDALLSMIETYVSLAKDAEVARQQAFADETTLALAYEQRTANLIAAQALNLSISKFSADVSNTIIERLGLEGGTK